MSILVHKFSRRFQLLKTSTPLPLYFCKKKKKKNGYPMKPMERHQPNSASFSIAGGGWGRRASVDHHVYTLTTRPVYIYTHTYVRTFCVCVCVCFFSVCLSRVKSLFTFLPRRVCCNFVSVPPHVPAQ